jgi:hypothetical protein
MGVSHGYGIERFLKPRRGDRTAGVGGWIWGKGPGRRSAHALCVGCWGESGPLALLTVHRHRVVDHPQAVEPGLFFPTGEA